MTTNRTPVFHLDTLNLNFSDYKKSFLLAPNPETLWEPSILENPKRRDFKK
jgi:hypothetical protein